MNAFSVEEYPSANQIDVTCEQCGDELVIAGSVEARIVHWKQAAAWMRMHICHPDPSYVLGLIRPAQ